MKEEGKRVSRRWRTATVLALGVVIGTILVAPPAQAHFLPSISHIWSHIKPLADVRYANAVAGTDKAKNADKLDGKDSTVFLNSAANARDDEQNSSPVTLTEYSTWTDVESTTITTDGTSNVLIVGQFTAQSGTNQGDAFAQVLVDGVKVDGNYWSNLGGSNLGAGAGRTTIPVSRVISLAAGVHTVELQGSYYYGGTDITVQVYARSISAIELS